MSRWFMKALATVTVLFSCSACSPATAQPYKPMHGRAFVSLGPSLTRYFGDLDGLPRQSHGMGNNLSFGYQIAPRIGVGLSLTGNWNVAGHGEGSTLAVMRLGVRSYLIEGPRAPFVDAAGLLVVGGPQTGGGLGIGAGYRFGLGKTISVAPTLRIDAVTPDRAADGRSSGASLDVLANFGLELSLSLPRRAAPPSLVAPRIPDSVATDSQVTFYAEMENWDGEQYEYTWQFGDGAVMKGEVVTHRYRDSGVYEGLVVADAEDAHREARAFEVRVVDRPGEQPQFPVTRNGRDVRIDSVYGLRQLSVGQSENFRVRIGPDAFWPVRYEWDMGDGVRSIGNNIVHFYRQPGYYRVRVAVSNQYGSDSTSAIIHVTPEQPATESVVARPPILASAAEGVDVRHQRRESTPTSHEEENPTRYYAWSLETHFDNASATAALRKYAGRGLKDVRVYVDRSGAGSTAYRVVVGGYSTTREAIEVRSIVESRSRRSPSLITIER